MAYDKELAQRIRALLEAEPDFVEKKMFGGVCYLLNGNMACGVLNDDLIVRVGPENYQRFLEHPHTRVFDITGRPMNGWVMVSPDGSVSDADLSAWIRRGTEFAGSLPSK